MGLLRVGHDWATSLSFHFCMKHSLVITNFLEEISSLYHSFVFLYFFALITEEDFLISLLAVLWNCAFKWVYLSFSPLLFTSLLYTAIYKASSDSHFAFLHFFFLGMVFIPVSCTMSWNSVHSSSGSLSDLALVYTFTKKYLLIKIYLKSKENIPDGISEV